MTIMIRPYFSKLIHKLKLLFSNWVIKYMTIISLVLSLITILFIWYAQSFLPNQIPLWYSKPWGIDRLAPPFYLFLLPCVNICLLTGQLIFSTFLFEEYLVFAQLLSLTSILISLLSSMSAFMIIWIIR